MKRPKAPKPTAEEIAEGEKRLKAVTRGTLGAKSLLAKASTASKAKTSRAGRGGGGYTGGGMFGMGSMPDMYNLIVNTNHPLVSEFLNTKTAKKKERLINQSLDLAKLSKGLLKGKALTEFIKRSYEMVK